MEIGGGVRMFNRTQRQDVPFIEFMNTADFLFIGSSGDLYYKIVFQITLG